MAPTTMRAFATTNRGIGGTAWKLATRFSIAHDVSVRQFPTPTPSATEVLVKVKAVAQNPTDYKHIDLLGRPNSILGCDYAGTVESVGASAKGNWKVGDRIAGVTHGGIYNNRGSYAEYLTIDGDLAWKIPESVPFTTAAVYGVSAVSAMQALNLVLGLPWPGEKPVEAGRELFIYGGSTSASLFAIQIAKMAGLRVITTCSPHSNDLVKSYGADEVYNYKDKSSLQRIKTAHPDLALAFDGFGGAGSNEFCCNVVANKNGKVVTLDPQAKSAVKGVELETMIMYTVFGRAFQLVPPIGPKFPVKLEDRAGLARFYAMLPKLVEEQKLRAPPIQLRGTGFDKIEEGLELLKSGKVSGQKLVLELY
ncbi:GroES-like protein [Aureobasidium pullulans]|uniref:GroES-like protein n=1 Tax=Aureobasidium pullulans TaxID=5580 RepID=A0A4S8W7F6_AURPU|nr:GroES-like protein [Aureobasidium pullulans]